MQPADDKLWKSKKIFGRKKFDTFRSPTRELVLEACYFVNKTRKAAGQLEQELIFLFESAALICHVAKSSLMSTFENAWTLFERIWAQPFFSIDEIFCWNFLMKNSWIPFSIHRATNLFLVQKDLLLEHFFLTIQNQKYDMFVDVKHNAQNWEDLFLRIKNTVSYKKSTRGIAL